MIFTRLEYIIIFLPIIVILSFLFPRRFLTAWLLLSSLIFYGWASDVISGSWLYATPFLVYSLLNYNIGKQMESCTSTNHRKLVLAFGILFNVAWWLVIKENLAIDMGLATGTIVSVGLGFYVLRAIGYLIEIYQKSASGSPGILHYILYLTFFAHVPSGPITSWKSFTTAMSQRLCGADRICWKPGFYLFSLGIFKKTAADLLGRSIDPSLNSNMFMGTIDSWAVLLIYSAQIYLDFSGYTDMALGAAKMMGIQLPINFSRPYAKRNLIEFWNAWHITLSQWLRDYIFTPIGRELFKVRVLRRSPLIIASICYLVTFTICGIWHGLEVTFLFWGLYHGVGLTCCKIYGEIARKYFGPRYFQLMFNLPIGNRLAVSFTFFYVVVGWVFFRSQTVAQSINWLNGLGGFNTLAPSSIDLNLIGVLGGIIIVGWIIAKFRWNVEQLKYWQRIILTSNLLIVLFYYYVTGNTGMAPFIYNRF